MTIELQIRPAQARDAEICAALIHPASPELYDYIFDDGAHRALEFMQFEFDQGGGGLGHRLHTAVELDGRVVGVGGLQWHEDLMRISVESTQNIVHFYGIARAREVLRRAGHGKSVIAKPEPQRPHTTNLGVDASVRGRGICSALLAQELLRARARGCKELSLDVAVNNPRAKALYERLGYRVMREQRFEGDPGAKVLDSYLMILAIT